MRLDRRKFRAWLAAKNPDAIVGRNRDCHACPIATFYCEASGGNEVVISKNENCDIVIDRGGGERLLPLWAERFVRRVDDEADGAITAGRALAILDVCELERERRR